jgi:DNA invertase Pin-like site-specific DNA recombinase
MATSSSTAFKPIRAVGYMRVSTAEQAGSGAGLEAQRAAIEREGVNRGWDLVEVCTDAAASGGSITGRPALDRALRAVEGGDADVLIVAKLDRLSRSLLDFAALMARAQQRGWNLVALDLGIDLSTPAGEFLANVMASAAQWERRIIGQRTREALAVRKAQGVRLGRPVSLGADVTDRIRKLRERGLTLAAIAGSLNAGEVPTAQGGARWHPSTVRAVLERTADADP